MKQPSRKYFGSASGRFAAWWRDTSCLRRSDSLGARPGKSVGFRRGSTDALTDWNETLGDEPIA